MTELTELDGEVTDQLVQLAQRIAQHDGVDAFGATALADLNRSRPRDEYAVVFDANQPIAFAWCDGVSAEFGVHPDHRGAGLGTRLLTEVRRRYPDVAVWAHGNLPGAAGVAAAAGLHPVRELWYMECDLQVIEELMESSPEEFQASLTPPPAMVVRSFRPEDTQAWLQTNAAAFANHPEQGRIDHHDFAELRAQPWWQPHLLRVVENTRADAHTPQLAGFVWLKPQAPGEMEIFVLGVHPHYQGQKLGNLLVREGLATAVNLGATRSMLYVDGADTIATHLYERFGFKHVSTDVQYAASPSAEPDTTT